jgi:Fur family ferric uptake transcriptional regulator
MASKAAALVDALRARLRDAGLRATAPRIAVLHSLVEATTPQSHGELFDRLSSEGWDRATIYRNLTDLTEASLARRTDLGDHVWRFEAIREGRGRGTGHSEASHPHFLCNECGEVVCLPDESVHLTPQRGAPRALRKKGLEIQIRGRCDRCA